MAVTLYPGLKYVATNGEDKALINYLGAAEEGATYWDVDNDALWQWNGSAWEQLFTSSTGASESFAIAMAVAL